MDADETAFQEFVRQRRARRVLLVLAVLVGALTAATGCGWAWFGYWRHARPRSLVRKYVDCKGLDVRAYYREALSKDDVVFDVVRVSSSVRRVDLVHAVLGFSRGLGGRGRTVLASGGREVFYLRRPDVQELVWEYSRGRRIWAIEHFAEYVWTMAGRKAYPKRAAGLWGVADRYDDLSDCADRWAAFAE